MKHIALHTYQVDRLIDAELRRLATHMLETADGCRDLTSDDFVEWWKSVNEMERIWLESRAPAEDARP